MAGKVTNKKYKDAEATQLFPDDPDAGPRARRDLPLLLILLMLTTVLYLAFAALIDPYKVFNIIDFNKRNFELSARYNKIEFLKKNPKQGFIFGTSRSNGLPVDEAAALTGLDFYHMTSPGDSYEGTYLKVKWVLENQPAKHLIISLDYDKAMGPMDTLSKTSLIHKEHPDVSGENPLAFYWSFFWAHPKIFAYTVHGNLVREGTWWWWDRETGHYHFVERERDMKEIPEQVFEERAKVTSSIVATHPSPVPTEVNPEKLIWIEKAVALAKAKGVTATVILNPVYFKALAWTGAENYTNWRRTVLSRIPGTWDFAALAAATCEDKNWFDTSHYAFSLGRIFLNIVLDPNGTVARNHMNISTAAEQAKLGKFGKPDRCDA